MDKLLIIIGMCMSLMIISSCSPDPSYYNIVDDSVFWENDYGMINVTPFKCASNYCSYDAELTMYLPSQEYDFAFKFDEPLNNPSLFESNIVSYEVLNNDTQQMETFYREEWIDRTQHFTMELYEGKVYYWVSGVFFTQNESKKYRWGFDNPGGNGKWELLGKRTSETLQSAIDNQHYIILDPWWEEDNHNGSYYRLDADGNDSGYYNADLAEANTPNYDAGKVDNAVHLDGTDYLTNTSYPDPQLLRSIDFWFSPDVVDTENHIFEISEDGTNFLRAFGTSGNKVYVYLYDGATIWSLTSTTSTAAGEWIHVIITFGATEPKMYINGNTTPEDTDTDTTVPLVAWDNIYIGTKAGFADKCDGKIDNVVLSTSVYTTSDVTYSWNSGGGRDFDPDIEIEINNLTLTPSPAYTSSTLNCSAMVNDTRYGNNLNVTFTSYNNSIFYSNETQTNKTSESTLSTTSIFPTPLTLGDTWYCNVYVEDVADSARNRTENTSSVTILSSPPTFDHNPVNWSDWHSTNISIDINCSDVDLDNLTYYISNLSADLDTPLAINNLTGLLGYNPSIFEVGNYSYNLSCGDGTTNTTQILNISINQNIINVTNTSKDTATEGDTITFYLKINITDVSTAPINISLLFNNTNYDSPLLVSSDNGSLYQYNYSQEVILTQGQGNATGYNQRWNWTYSIQDVVIDYNTSTKNLTVYSVELDDCSVYSQKILEYTVKDEEERTVTGLTNISIEADILLASYYNSSLTWNFSVEKTANPLTVCITNYSLENSSFQMDVITRYSCDDHAVEYNYIVNYTLVNSTYINTSLYDLHDDESTSFLITYKDSSYLPLENAIIDLWRYYVGTGEYLSVEHAKTNDQGETRLHLVTEDVKYIFYVRKDGALVYTSPEYLAICQATPCQINLQEAQEGIEHPDYQKVDNLDYSISLDRESRIATVEYSTDDGTSTTLLINITTHDAYLNESVCTSTATSSGGTLICEIPETFANTTYRLTLHKDEEFVADRSFNLNPHPLDNFGYTGIILVALMFLTLTLMAVPTSATAAIFFGVMGLVFAGALNLFAPGGAIFKGTLTMIWLVVAAGILIVKISSRRQS